MERQAGELRKIETGIPGFDWVTAGGLPAGRTTLVAGTAGSAKTILAAHFLRGGVERRESGVFVTFEEPAANIRANLASLGWDVAQMEADGRWAFVDAAPTEGDEGLETGSYDLEALAARIEAAVRRVGATRVAVDSFAALLPRLGDARVVRRELFRITLLLNRMGVTTVLTAERTEEYGPVARFEVEEFVIDAVVVLRNVLDAQQRRRTVEVVKMRGANHQKGEYPFSVMPGAGVSVVPLAAVTLERESSSSRITTGNAGLDAMCGGGLFAGSVTLISGATGCGKTLLACEFACGGASRGERTLYLAFEESRSQLERNAASWGMDLSSLEGAGTLRVAANYPETATLEDHLVEIKRLVAELSPERLVLDSLSAMERAGSEVAFKQFAVALTALLKAEGVSVVYTVASPSFLGGGTASDNQVSTLTDAIVLLRYVETAGAVDRAITFLKMRGSKQDSAIRRFAITDRGLEIGETFGEATGMLGGYGKD